jgi:cobalamin biosynthesis protein CobC
MLSHGGNLAEVAAQYGIPEDQWLDLSTGLNPIGWEPKEMVPIKYLAQLPYPDNNLLNAAIDYYGTEQLLPIPGSQAAIQVLPQLKKAGSVAIPVPGYEEHIYHWQKNGHKVSPYNAEQDNLLELVQRDQPDVVLIINPNNPTGHIYTKNELLNILEAVERYAGLLIIDEAFIDTHPEHSLSTTTSDSLIILRSLGKFFGLPGVRVGFVIANRPWRDAIESALGPWAVSGPSQWIATQCLKDIAWQHSASKSLQALSKRQFEFLSEAFTGISQNIGSSDYFNTLHLPEKTAEEIRSHFAQHGILIRKIDLTKGKSLLRFGLCAGEKYLNYFQQVACSYVS